MNATFAGPLLTGLPKDWTISPVANVDDFEAQPRGARAGARRTYLHDTAVWTENGPVWN